MKTSKGNMVDAVCFAIEVTARRDGKTTSVVHLPSPAACIKVGPLNSNLARALPKRPKGIA
eukprot:1160591-Pelagomonas_calceolata.AAC.3